MNFPLQNYSRCRGRKVVSRFSDRARLAFTLLEVMIAVMILFMCLFAVLALLSNSLASARRIQQANKGVDVGTVAGKLYVQLYNTNQIDDGPFDCDLDDVYPGYHIQPESEPAGTNGLRLVTFDVIRSGRVELHSQFLIYKPDARSGAISRSLPRH